MATLIARLLAAAVMFVATAGTRTACRGRPEPQATPANGGAESAGADDGVEASEAPEEANPQEEPAEADETAQEAEETEETEAAEADDQPEEVEADEASEADEPDTPAPPKEPGRMLDVFQQLAVGDWVLTRWTNKEEHTLLVAAKAEKTITIEEIVRDRGFVKAWTQLDVSLEDGTLLALRERLADGTIEAREPEATSQRGTSDLLIEPFRPDGHDEQQARIEVHAPERAEPEVLRGTFFCRRYKVTVEEGRYARLWFSRKKLPDYPIKIHYYERNLTITLEAFGTGRASEFTKKPAPPRRGRPGAQ